MTCSNVVKYFRELSRNGPKMPLPPPVLDKTSRSVRDRMRQLRAEINKSRMKEEDSNTIATRSDGGQKSPINVPTKSGATTVPLKLDAAKNESAKIKLNSGEPANVPKRKDKMKKKESPTQQKKLAPDNQRKDKSSNSNPVQNRIEKFRARLGKKKKMLKNLSEEGNLPKTGEEETKNRFQIFLEKKRSLKRKNDNKSTPIAAASPKSPTKSTSPKKAKVNVNIIEKPSPYDNINVKANKKSHKKSEIKKTETQLKTPIKSNKNVQESPAKKADLRKYRIPKKTGLAKVNDMPALTDDYEETSKSTLPSNEFNFQTPEAVLAPTPNDPQLNAEPMDIDMDSVPDESNKEVEQMEIDDVVNIVNDARKDVKDGNASSLIAKSVQSDSNWKKIAEEADWFLVIDTNVYISSLSFVKSICDTKVPGLGYPVIYVPHRVLCELDGLKASVAVVKSPARAAIAFINSCLEKKHPRVKGQTLSNYKAMADLMINDSDDKILLSCLQLRNCEKRIIFLSNDINLRNKAMIEDMETYSVKEFEKIILSNDKEDDSVMNKNMLELRLTTLLQSVLTEILNGEIGNARPKDLNMAVESLITHWPKSFSTWIPVMAEEHLQNLREQLAETNGNQCLVKLIDCAVTFLQHFQIKSKIYFNNVKKTLAVLNSLRSRAVELQGDDEVNEKYCYGALEDIFRDSWLYLDTEFEKIKAAKESNDMKYKTMLKTWIEFLEKFVPAISNLLSCSAFQVGTSEALIQMVSVLAPCLPTYSEENLKLLIRKVAITEKGRDLLRTAEVHFRSALQKMSQT